MHVHHTAPDDRVVDLLTLDDCDRLLTGGAIRTPAVRLVHEGSVLPERQYTRGATLAGKPLTGLVDPRTALSRFEQGATVVLQGLHRYHPPLARLIGELELELGHPCQANAYLTPAGARGFAVHRDSHDVFVVQTTGRKQWELHGDDGIRDQPTARSAGGVGRGGRVSPASASVRAEATGASRPEQVPLEPGLSMYLPTGTPHAARAQDDVSLHVTIGINQLTWRGLLRRSLEPALERVPDSHLPAGYLDDDTALRDQLAQRLEDLADEVRGLDPRAALDAEVRRFLTTRPTRHLGGLTDTVAAAGITDHTLLRRPPGRPCVLQHPPDRPDRLTVLLGDRWLDVPARLEPALERIRSRAEILPTQLADVLDQQSRLVLCRRLVREGLLTLGAARE